MDTRQNYANYDDVTTQLSSGSFIVVVLVKIVVVVGVIVVVIVLVFVVVVVVVNVVDVALLIETVHIIFSCG